MKAWLVAVGMLFLAGCLVQGERSKAKIDLDPATEIPTHYEDCREDIDDYGHFTEHNPLAGVRLGSGSLRKCEIIFGYSHSANKPSFLRAEAVGKRSDGDGDLAPVQQFMDATGITCVTSPEKITFQFPIKNVGHKDYKEVEVRCPASSEEESVVIEVVFNKDSSSINFDIRFANHHDRGSTTIYHLIDTDDNGVIKKHVKITGKGGKKEVILDGYKLQKAK